LRKAVKVKIPWKPIGKFIVASAVMGLVLFYAHPVKRSTTLILTVIGGLIYIAILAAIDKETRTLTRTTLQMIRTRMTQLLRNPRKSSSPQKTLGEN